MSRKPSTRSNLESRRDVISSPMMLVSVLRMMASIVSLVSIQGVASANDIPSITSMQRRIVPQADETTSQPMVMPGRTDSTEYNSTPVFQMPAVETVQCLQSPEPQAPEPQAPEPQAPEPQAPEPQAQEPQAQLKPQKPPTFLPTLPPKRKPSHLPSTVKQAPIPTRLPTPAVTLPSSPARLPASELNFQAATPDFELWQPPGIFEPKPSERSKQYHFPEQDSGMIIDGESDLLLAPPLSTINSKPISEIMQVAAWEESPRADSTANTFSLVDRSVCPSMSWAHADDFSATPLPVEPWFHDTDTEQTVYDDKHPVPTQRPLIEWGRKFYGSGITPPSETWLGKTNLVQQQLYLYGDYRTAIATGRDDAARLDNWASRLNLDLDYRITATERFHAFFGPLNRATQFNRLERVDGDWEYQTFYNLNPVTAYFEGDAGALLGGAAGTPSPFELPITAGLVPLVFQNGIWMEDAVSGFAFAIPARHSRLLNWANFDATFFAVFDQINSPAFGADNHAGQAFGSALFIDAYDGYIETGYAYLNDREGLGRDYHNMTASYTRRYFDRISNSVRIITNMGQDLPKADRTADGTLLLIENSLVSHEPLTFVPYFNLFAGWGRPQSVARAGIAGGVLRNTGINFEIDGLNGYPTLDATGADTAGGSIGIDLIGDDLDRQLLLEASYLTAHGDRAFVSGDQFALGTRYQVAISHRSIIRFDTMYGWEQGDNNIYGTRLEYRWKF